MPNYQYRCPKCGETIEQVRPVEDRDDLPQCFHAAADVPMQRVITAPAKVWHPSRSMEQGGKLAEY